ncbi:MAG: hypothetical protein ABDH21_03105 [bacterium]
MLSKFFKVEFADEISKLSSFITNTFAFAFVVYPAEKILFHIFVIDLAKPERLLKFLTDVDAPAVLVGTVLPPPLLPHDKRYPIIISTTEMISNDIFIFLYSMLSPPNMVPK